MLFVADTYIQACLHAMQLFFLKLLWANQNSPIEIRLLGLTLCTKPTSSPYINLVTANENLS